MSCVRFIASSFARRCVDLAPARSVPLDGPISGIVYGRSAVSCSAPSGSPAAADAETAVSTGRLRMDAWTGGRAVVELLKAEGVRHIFGIVGATFLDVLDALYDDRSVEYLDVRHEQAAAFMADGLARVTDRPGVCLVTSGPGATNLMTGVAAAHVAHSPVVVLVGGIALDHYQKDAFQEFDLLNMFRPVTKLAVQITKADRIPELLRGALRTAMSGRQGPVFVEIPRDVLNG